MDLLQRTYDLIDSARMTRREIANGAGVDINWLDKLKQRRIKSPGTPKVQKVHDFLNKKSRRN